MSTKVKKNQINFNGKMVSIGIDMHQHSWRITALVEGNIVMAVTLASQVDGQGSWHPFKYLLQI